MTFAPLETLAQLRARLDSGVVTSAALTEAALARIAVADGEGARAFIAVHADAARTQAAASDALRRHGIVASPLAGIPISIKDLFDVAGETTRAGARVRETAPAASADAPVVARLRAAGAVIVGRTNMTEFAFSGVGINPHYGTPLNPYDRAGARIPGGSSSGAAVSVSDGMAAAAIGTDTGGSVRVPAALCGLTGFKPSQRRVSRHGVFPLAPSLDSVGPIGPSVACCALLDAIMAEDAPTAAAPIDISALRLGVVTNYFTEGLDDQVARAHDRALTRLSEAGASLREVALTPLDRLAEVNAKGGIPPAEAYAIHRETLAREGERYDPRVRARILRGTEMDAADYISVCAARADIIAACAAIAAPFDALLAPTVPVIAPPLTAFARDDDYVRLNGLLLRNPAAINFLDGCAASLPCHTDGEAPVGLMVIGGHMADARLLASASAIEAVIRPARARH